MTAAEEPLQIGRYEVLGKLGSGDMGVVYKARDPLIDRLVALKTIGVGQVGADALAYRQRFFREARSAGGLNHPNIVTIHDVGESGDVAYIAMEFLSGHSLREVLDTGTVLPVARIADIAAQIADGLAFAHDKGIVHRDIKPANIMVLDNGLVKITDFGIALLPSGTRTLAGTVFGSPRYISPERLRGDHVDGRSDIFSLGAVLYEMLTGLPPFVGNDLNSLLYQILSVMPMAPSSRNRNIPHAFDFIVATALAKDPAERYRNAATMAADLRNFAELGAGASPPATPAAAAPPGVRSPVPSSAPATSAVSAPAAAPLAASARAPASSTAPQAATPEEVPPAHDAVAPSTRDESTPEALVPMLEAPPLLLPTGPAMVSPRWRNPALLAIPALLLALLAGVTLWPRGAGMPAPAPVVAAVAPAADKAGNGEAGRISTKSLPPPAPTSPAAPAEPVTTASTAPASSPAAAAAPTVAPATERPAAKPAVVAAKPTAVLGIAVAPWGEVYVNGRKMGVSPPLTELRLAPGKYVVEIRNTTFPAYRETIDLATQNSFRIRHKFQ